VRWVSRRDGRRAVSPIVIGRRAGSNGNGRPTFAGPAVATNGNSQFEEIVCVSLPAGVSDAHQIFGSVFLETYRQLPSPIATMIPPVW
jgi:hypothetical protein